MTIFVFFLLLFKLPITFGVIEGVHVSVDVALQVGVEAGCWREKGQTDGHQFPATFQAIIPEVLCGLTAQLDVKLITQTLVTPATHHNLTETGREPCHCKSMAFIQTIKPPNQENAKINEYQEVKNEFN